MMPPVRSTRSDNGSILAMRLERDAARFELERTKVNFYRLIWVAALGWLFFSAAVFGVLVGFSSSRHKRDSTGAVNGAPPPIFQRLK